MGRIREMFGAIFGRPPIVIRFDGDVRRINFQPGDRFVLTLRGMPLTPEVMEQVRASWKLFWEDEPDAPKVFVLRDGQDLAAVPAVFDADQFMRRKKRGTA